MPGNDYPQQWWFELSDVLEKMIQGHIGLTEGCRQIVKKGHELNLTSHNNPSFASLVGYDSECDTFPLGEMRKLCSADWLAKADSEREKTENHYRVMVIEQAKSLLVYVKTQSKDVSAHTNS